MASADDKSSAGLHAPRPQLQNTNNDPVEGAKATLDSSCCLLDYISNTLEVLNYISSVSSTTTSSGSNQPAALPSNVRSSASDVANIEQQQQQLQQSTTNSSNDQANFNNQLLLLPNDWIDDNASCFNMADEDDESLVDDSDDESLCNKLCTFTLTQKEFANQHWYHCHTCNMVDRVGVCSVCAKVCHKDHDVSYAKYGAFFCDCAGRENSTCMALVKRLPPSTSEDINNYQLSASHHNQSTTQKHEDTIKERNIMDGILRLNSSNLNANSKDTNSADSKRTNLIQQHQYAKQIEPIKSDLVAIITKSNISNTTTNLLSSLIPAYVKFANNESHIGRAKRARTALDDLHSAEKTFHMTESLMLPTLGSQEGAFENVRVNYSGEHASSIKQLLSNNTLRRVAMTSLSSPLGKRQHLVVCHEKGKITLLQLNALLRQADSSKRKLTLTRLASAPIPFSVISIVANPFNEDVLAVCGLKDCHILTFTNNGLVSSHIELHLDLSNANEHLIKVVWIPGGQTEIAILTSEVVKIYDLSEDSNEPKYHLRLAFGQPKDLTFIVPETKLARYILIMDTIGHIYSQALDPKMLTTQELFYVTLELHLNHPNIKEQDGKINGGGISLYYSHSFKMLFFSYANGNFMASLPKPQEVQRVFPLEFEFSNNHNGSISSSNSDFSTSSGPATYASVTAGHNEDTNSTRAETTSTDDSSPHVETPASEESSQQKESTTTTTSTITTAYNTTNTFQPLCQWSEVQGHVGVIMAVCLHSNNPVILMLRPDCVYAQEIRYLTINSKITDATAIRHTTSSREVRTTLILLCEDGSLRIYMASQELTEFWLKLSLNPNNAAESVPHSFLSKSSKRKNKITNKSLRKINPSNSSTTFPVDFFENLQPISDIEFGGSDVLSVYSIQQLKTRLNASGMHVACSKPSGFSMEIINNDLNMVICGIRIQVGSQGINKSPSSVEMFGRTIPLNPSTSRWYDLPMSRDESLLAEKRMTLNFGTSPDPNAISIIDSIKVYGKSKESFSWPDDVEDQTNSVSITGDDLFEIFMGQESTNRYQKLLIYLMRSYECCLNLESNSSKEKQQKLANELSTSLLTVPYPPHILKAIKSLLLTIYSNKQNYYQHRDSAALNFIKSSLITFKEDQIDAELFSRNVFIMKSLCQSKLSNLVKLSECVSSVLIEKDPTLESSLTTGASKINLLITHLHQLFWHLYSLRPANISLASVASSGYFNYGDTLQPLIELIYIATLHDLSILSVATDVIIGFLLSDDLNISLCARQTLIRLLRVRGVQQHNEICDNGGNITQTGNLSDLNQQVQQAISITAPNELNAVRIRENIPVTPERYDLLSEQPSSLAGSQQSSIASQLRNVLSSEATRQDEDDIAIAIALSLQDDSQNNSVTDNAVTAAPTTSGRSEINFLSDRMPSAEELMSDTTASGVASDDEVSASIPKLSSSIQRNSRIQSLDGVTQSSSTQEVDNMNREKTLQQSTSGQDNQISISENKTGSFEQERLRQQHLMLLERLIEHLPDTRDAGGFRSISLLHVILVLTLDLDCDNEVDDAILKNLLHALRQELLWNTSQPETLGQRNPTNEVKLVIMKMFSILMSKVRTSSVASAVSSATRAETDSCWSTLCSSVTALSLIESNVMEFCYSVLKHLVNYWKTMAEINPNQINSTLAIVNEPIVPVNRKTLPKTTNYSQFPDLSPFFLRQYVRGHGTDLFEDYTQLLTEMVLKIPYQIKKVSTSPSNNLNPVTFSNEWSTILCEYLMIPIPSYIKKHVRKLLTSICGSKDKYRQLRDFHFLESHMKAVKSICGHSDEEDPQDSEVHFSEDEKIITLSYESMTSLVEHLKSCIEIAQNRCINWQVYCLIKDQGLLPFLMKISLQFGDDVSPIVLELLQHALSYSQLTTNQNMTTLLDTPIISTATPNLINDQTLRDILTSESLSANLAQQLITSITKNLLSKFIQTFLLETNLTSIRWQAHGLLYNLWSNFLPEQQRDLVQVLWSLWRNLPKYGRKAAQFVDLVGFVTLKIQQSFLNNSVYESETMYCEETIKVLRQQNQLLLHHPNAQIYSSIQGLVDLESYYLESEPCSVCNSPEMAYNNIKLSSIKVDSRFTTTTQIIKLIGSHTISKFTLRVSDIKRSKMVKTINIFYNNRTVQSVVELKNKTGIWNLARRYSLTPNQSDVKIEFTLPIVACNLMIEFSEFYENFQANSETLQCPRCSTSVSANPGVCTNCGENVFQCHKCRAINYDEKDPFLCISCGFCKYARFDISLMAKPTCAVDPIENEEDRKKTVASISSLLEKADRVYKNLTHNKPTLELLLLRIHDQIIPDRQLEETILNGPDSNNSLSLSTNSLNNGGATLQANSLHAQSIVVGYGQNTIPSALTSSVNKAIQHLAQKYCVECKGLFEELSKITHKVLASRRELVEYDNRQLRRCLNAKSSVLSSANRRKSKVYSSLTSGSGDCYGCATATVEHCVTMLKALSTIYGLRTQICDSGIINELVSFNLKDGNTLIGQEVRHLLCSLTRDDFKYTTILTDLLMDKISAISKQDYLPYEISHIVRHEIALLSVTLESDDQCWELRLKCLIKIFAFAFELKNPTITETLIIPCLKLLLSIIRPPTPTTRRHKEKTIDNIASARSDNYRSRVLLQQWLDNQVLVFEDWRKRAARPTTLAQGSKQMKTTSAILRRQSKQQSRSNYLAEKYGNRWRLKTGKFNSVCQPIESLPNDWLKRLLFNRASKTVRSMGKCLVESLFAVQSRRKEIVDLLTSYLPEIGPAGECSQEFYHLYKNTIQTDHWRYYLALKGILVKIGELITIEIDNLQELEETTLNSGLSLGYSLKMLVELLTTMVTIPKIRSHYKSKLVGFVLKGYLSLRKLVVQRTKVIDETQEMLLELLEGMTTGSESETAAFINVCVEAIKNCHEGDIRTPVFIFERLCSTIHPEENISSEFFVSIEKDPQQEDYLQGRMLGNPYSSTESGIGPLMKDIKNKICQDCELLALLEDDSSMELLVANKIVSLDLSVRDVYKRIWLPDNHESDAMRIIYRMRGLLGDATEEFIESFDSRNNEEIDEEQVYKMANIMSTSGGLDIMLSTLKQIDDLSTPFKPLLNVILKLFSYCTKTQNNRLQLLSNELKTIEILLNTLKLALNDHDFLDLANLPKDALKSSDHSANLVLPQSKQSTLSCPSSKTQVVDPLLAIIETISREASKQPKEIFSQFCSNTCGSVDDVKFLLKAALALNSKLSHVSHKIIQVIPFLTLGDKEKMSVLINYFKPSIDFEVFDKQHSAINDSTIDLFCIMVDAIEHNENGNQLKDFIVSENILSNSMKYLTSNAPPLKSSLLATSQEWKEFTSRPALKYVLRILGGLSKEHASTQVLISRDCIPVVHGLEQVSSDARVGTLAENLLESIKQHPSVAEKIELVRRQTKEEKKKLAMAVRERQLGALGMKANERGQVTAKSKLLEQCLDLAEDSGLICNICREGYKFQPTKVLGIYTYTKRCILDEFESKSRKSYGHTTVTHFNTVHFECHMSAVRSARGRDEWDSAALQNANTRCNGLLPIWGPEVPESAYANALARNNTYLQDSTGYKDMNYNSSVHDIRLLLLRFAQERSFSEDTGGGGPQSNLHLLPYMMQTALYILDSSKVATREYKRTLNYLDMSSNEILENCYEVDGPYYWVTMALLVLPPMWWKKKRLQFLQLLITCNHVRRVSIKPPAPMSDTRVRAYAYYKSALIYFALIDCFYNIVFKDAVIDGSKWNQDWSASLAEYLKHNHQTVNDNIEVLLNLYQNSLLTCTSLDRFFEIIRMDEVTQPSEFLANTLESV